MTEVLHNLWETLIHTGLKIIYCAVILIIGWFIIRAIARLLGRLLAKTRLDGFTARHGLRRYTGRYAPTHVITKIVYYVLLIFLVEVAFAVFGPNPVSDVVRVIIAWVPRTIVAIVIVAVTVAITNAVADLIRNTLAHVSYGRAVARGAQIAILAIGIIATLNQIGVAPTVTIPLLIAALATIAGILIVGVGGGLIQPMRERWERALTNIESERARLAADRRAAGHGEDPAGTGTVPPEPSGGPAADRDL